MFGVSFKTKDAAYRRAHRVVAIILNGGVTYEVTAVPRTSMNGKHKPPVKKLTALEYRQTVELWWKAQPKVKQPKGDTG